MFFGFCSTIEISFSCFSCFYCFFCFLNDLANHCCPHHHATAHFFDTFLLVSPFFHDNAFHFHQFWHLCWKKFISFRQWHPQFEVCHSFVHSFFGLIIDCDKRCGWQDMRTFASTFKSFGMGMWKWYDEGIQIIGSIAVLAQGSCTVLHQQTKTRKRPAR